MRSVLKLSVFILFLSPIIFSSCQKEFLCADCPNELPVNSVPPIARAGDDQVIILPTNSTTLDGSSSLGNSLSYKWIKLSGPSSLNIVTPESAETQIENLVSGVYSLQLTVTCNGGATSKDTINVTVVDKSKKPPVAIAGDDQTLLLPNNTTTLNAESSYDPDGNIVSYDWHQVGGTNVVTINNPKAAIAELIAPVDGIYQLKLTVTDNDGLFTYDTIVINVVAPSSCPPATLTWSLDESTGLMALIDSSLLPVTATLNCGAGAESLIPTNYDVYINVEGTATLIRLSYVFRNDIAATSESIFLSSTLYSDPNDGDLSYPIVYAKPDAAIDFTKRVTVRNIK
jgi:hypothetical protein